MSVNEDFTVLLAENANAFKQINPKKLTTGQRLMNDHVIKEFNQMKSKGKLSPDTMEAVNLGVRAMTLVIILIVFGLSTVFLGGFGITFMILYLITEASLRTAIAAT